jgi:hypothetical protein
MCIKLIINKISYKMSYKSRQESDEIAKNCFYQADQDRSNSITIY